MRIYLIVGVSCLRLLDDMTLVTAANDRNIFVWRLSTARAPGKTLVLATQTHRAESTGQLLIDFHFLINLVAEKGVHCFCIMSTKPLI